jgi:drug/metabolite transporter (DMT)-like permease
MTALVFALVVGSAFLHAAWNALLKRHPDPEAAAPGMFAVCAIAGAAAAAFWPGARAGGISILWSGVAGAFEAGYIMSLARALARAPLGPVYTVSRGGALLLVWPLSVAWLGERVTASALLGTALVAAGLAATGLGAGGGRRRENAGSGLRWAGIAAVCIGCYHLAYKQALATGGAPAVVFAVSLGLAVPLTFARLDRAGRAAAARAVRARPAIVVSAGLISCASFLVFLFGLAQAGAGAVFTLRNTSVLFAQVLSWTIGERPTRLGALGAAAVAGGAVLLSWP